MIIHAIELHNIGNHELLKIDFDQPLTAICGSNGSGKTFLIESIPACLYGVFPSRSGSLYDKIGDDASITIDFEYEDRHYCATRKMNKKKGTSEGYLYLDGSLLSGPKISDFESTIRGMIGSYESYISSAFSSQKIAGDICDFKPGQRKAFFSNLFNLSKFDRISDSASNRASEIKHKAEEIEDRVQLFNQIKSERPVDVDQLQTKLVLINQEITWRAEKITELSRLKNVNASLIDNKVKYEYLCQMSIPHNNACLTCPLPGNYYEEKDSLERMIDHADYELKDYDPYELAEQGKIHQGLVAQKTEIENELYANKERERMMDTAKQMSVESIEDPSPYILLSEVFGRNGIQPLIIESEKGPLENLINEILAILTNGKMKACFSTLKELRDGRQAESLDIVIYKDGIMLDVSTLSGGEQRLVKIAIRMALAINNNRFKIKTLIIDEVFDDLDATNSVNVLNVIKNFSNYFARVVVVSHDDRLLSEFPALIDLDSISSSSSRKS